ncbi:hypothetical protein [Stakelama saccharophila]|uniref:Lipoprotein n=1 Tax=Stakelama saccharophila TaxID=3075605 RepID=A0ABZ0B824_9SPHN|nr:hypothetical protein [Stakelama sp. W311]WNO53585.1 hypothetical protein RPR59_14280 [Stakelama sp. W311]
MRPILPTTTLALALAACSGGSGTSNSASAPQSGNVVDATTTANGLTVQPTSDAGTAPGRDWHRYTNARFDFALEVPPGFAADEAPRNKDGRVFRKSGARLRVFGSHNALAEDFDAQIARARKGLGDVQVVDRTPATWRATAMTKNGEYVAILLARPSDSRIVTAQFTWPKGMALKDTAERALDSLLMVGHAGPLTFRYQPERLAAVATALRLPPDYDRAFDATKLLPLDRRAKLGKNGCRYGLSGRTSTCSAEKEAGLSFAVVDLPLATLRDRFDASRAARTTLARREGFRVEQTAEGMGATYTFLPAGDRTVVIEHRHREHGDGTATMAVLRGLTFVSGAPG